MIEFHPKFDVGQTVYFPTWDAVSVPDPCPDCLGTYVWKVITPGGLEMETGCKRCNSNQLSHRDYKPRVKSLVIGRVRFDSAGSGWADRVDKYEYQSNTGDCSIYYESSLCETEEAAMAVAELRCRELREKDAGDAAQAERMRAYHDLLRYDFQTAKIKAAEEKIWETNQRLHYMLDALARRLESGPYIGSFREGSPLGEYSNPMDLKQLTAVQIHAIQDTIVRAAGDVKLEERFVKMREEKANECHCD